MSQIISFLGTKIDASSNDVTYGQVVVTLLVLVVISAVIIFKAQRETSKNA